MTQIFALNTKPRSITDLMGNETGLDYFDNVQTNYLELHVYDMNGKLISSGYDISGWSIKQDNEKDFLAVDLHNNIRSLGFYSGKYKFSYRLFKSLLGTPIDSFCKVDEISNSRTEVRILLNPSSPNQIKDAFNLIPAIARYDNSMIKRNLALNFGKNRISIASNWKKDTWTYPVLNDSDNTKDAIVFKLTEPIDDTVKVGDNVAIAILLTDEIHDTIRLYSANQTHNVNVLAGANFSAKVSAIQTRKETEYENFQRLLGANSEINSQIINKYFSGSATELNIDYTSFENFIFYSSAVKRLENFRYKLMKIESYDASIASLLAAASASVTSSEAIQADVISYTNKKNAIIGSFDGFENYMYYQSSSYVSNSFGVFESRTWPKRNSSPPYILYSYTSSEAENWYNSLITSASFFDKNNVYALTHLIPEYIQNDEYSEQYVTFVQMVAQHFDLLWLYIKNSLQILDRDESIYNGLSKDLVYYTLRSMGWDVEDNYRFDELWAYLLGTNASGSTPIPGVQFDLQPSQSLIYVHSQSLATRDVNMEIWKRLLNNLPYLLKTKGTKKSLDALLNIYGIPSTILRIREYGGPNKIDATSQYRYNKFNYALNINGNDAVYVPNYVLSSTLNTPISTEFRFKTVNGSVFNFPLTNNSWSYQTLYRTDAGNLAFTIKHTKGIYGDLYFSWIVKSGSTIIEGVRQLIQNATIFDGKWWSILISRKDFYVSPKLQIYLKQSNYGEITHAYSCSLNLTSLHPSASVITAIQNAFTESVFWRLGGGAAGPTGSYSGSDQTFLNLYPFTGSVQEFRFWARELSEKAFDNHVRAPLAHNFTTAEGVYENLVMRLPLGSDLHTSYSISTNTFLSIHPNQYVLTSLNGTVLSGSYITFGSPLTMSFSDNTEEYSAEWPDLSGNRSISNKVRVEDNSLIGNLNVNKSVEYSSYDKYPLESSKLGVYFSPTNEVDENIAEFFGGIRIDDYIGDYSNIYENHYDSLESLRRYYFRQYNRQFNVIDYIRLVQYFDQSIWRQIKKLSPARAALNTGLVIEPHLLNRSKASFICANPTSIDLLTTMSLNAGLHVTWSGTSSTIDADIYGGLNITMSHVGFYSGSVLKSFNVSINNISSSVTPLTGYMLKVFNTDADYVFVDSLDNISKSKNVATFESTIDIIDSVFSINENLTNGESLSQPRTRLLYYVSGGSVHWFTDNDDKMYAQNIQPIITSSRTSQTLCYQIVSESLVGGNYIYNRFYYPADIQDFTSQAMLNQKWIGCKISSPDFNVASPNTYDGGPVVEYYRTNPNTIYVNESVRISSNDSTTPSDLRVE